MLKNELKMLSVSTLSRNVQKVHQNLEIKITTSDDLLMFHQLYDDP